MGVLPLLVPLPPCQEDTLGEMEAPDEACELYQWDHRTVHGGPGTGSGLNGREPCGKGHGRRVWNCGPGLDATALIQTETNKGVMKHLNGLTVRK